MKKSFALIFFLSLGLFAQDSVRVATKEDVENVKGALDGLNESYLETKTTVDALKKIKISGYVQTQFQATDGITGSTFNGGSLPAPGAYSGGAFPNDVASRFSVRRGRIKFNYDNDLTQYVMQFDVTQGGFGIKDMYASIKEPYLKLATFTGGIFDRPFGFEISYSSSNREAPERSRLYQTLFPGERELGAKIELAPQDGFLSMFNAKVGVFNGNNNNNNENDNQKDIIGRIGAQIPLVEQNLEIDGGLSFYSGKVTNNSNSVATISTDASGNKIWSVDVNNLNIGKTSDRSYFGVDMQLYYDLPVLGGLSLRGEYITGTQPGTSGSSSFYQYSKATVATLNNPDLIVTNQKDTLKAGTVKITDPTKNVSAATLYSRKFAGWYINYIQNIGMSEQIVVKYDVYDPNTDLKSTDVGVNGITTAGDIKFSTLGFGLVHHFDGNVKLTLYYEIVTNESINAATTNAAMLPYTQDLKDNVLTVRMQYKF